ncbi:U11/U12 small nuclear ribonucleoprotein [Trichinella spiralis]|uniref:U11/U12 small nuclear ribonucleoprotein n=1 Tax=Trichinella spiralis TaxID=6334 RepID=A0ABR3KCH8_TRISP
MYWNEGNISDQRQSLQFGISRSSSEERTLEKRGRGQPSRGPASKGIEFGLQSAMAPTVVGGSDEKRRLLSSFSIRI